MRGARHLEQGGGGDDPLAQDAVVAQHPVPARGEAGEEDVAPGLLGAPAIEQRMEATGIRGREHGPQARRGAGPGRLPDFEPAVPGQRHDRQAGAGRRAGEGVEEGVRRTVIDQAEGAQRRG